MSAVCLRSAAFAVLALAAAGLFGFSPRSRAGGPDYSIALSDAEMRSCPGGNSDGACSVPSTCATSANQTCDNVPCNPDDQPAAPVNQVRCQPIFGSSLGSFTAAQPQQCASGAGAACTEKGTNTSVLCATLSYCQCLVDPQGNGESYGCFSDGTLFCNSCISIDVGDCNSYTACPKKMVCAN